MQALECAFCLIHYATIRDNSEINLKQKKRKDETDVCFYTNQLLIEFTNTIHSHMQLLNNLPDYCFDRNSSMPLEHLFGRARVRAKDIHTLKKFIDSVAYFQTSALYKPN